MNLQVGGVALSCSANSLPGVSPRDLVRQQLLECPRVCASKVRGKPAPQPTQHVTVGRNNESVLLIKDVIIISWSGFFLIFCCFVTLHPGEYGDLGEVYHQFIKNYISLWPIFIWRTSPPASTTLYCSILSILLNTHLYTEEACTFVENLSHFFTLPLYPMP